MQGTDLSRAVTEGLEAVDLLADSAADKLVSSYRQANMFICCVICGFIGEKSDPLVCG